jgi:hypothetical protein
VDGLARREVRQWMLHSMGVTPAQLAETWAQETQPGEPTPGVARAASSRTNVAAAAAAGTAAGAGGAKGKSGLRLALKAASLATVAAVKMGGAKGGAADGQ